MLIGLSHKLACFQLHSPANSGSSLPIKRFSGCIEKVQNGSRCLEKMLVQSRYFTNRNSDLKYCLNSGLEVLGS